MKELLSQYSSYNYWANERLLNVTLQLTNEQQQQIIKSSFKSLYTTILHIWDAESIWWQRIKLQEQIITPSEISPAPSMQEMTTSLLTQSRQWKEWVHQLSESQLEHVFAYYNTKKEYFKNPTWQALLHLFNHSTYHRGQVITVLHALGIDKVPNTDFIQWVRKK